MTRSSAALPSSSLSKLSHSSDVGGRRIRVPAAVLGVVFGAVFGAVRCAAIGAMFIAVRFAAIGAVLVAMPGELALRVVAEEGQTRPVSPGNVRRAPEGDAAKIEFFRQKVAPVLKEHCFECHSRGADEVKGDLLLDSQAALLKGGANGPAVVPGDVEASFLIRAIRYTEDDYKMPPRGKLDDDVIRDLEKWIKDGAKSNLPKESP